jgi:hypothetical protein
MIRVVEIIEKTSYKLVCKFNNGMIKTLDVLPIIENHKQLNGVQKLLNDSVFNTVRIGEFGEIVWDKIVMTTQNGEEMYWDYDISPEFAFENSTFVEPSFTIAS